MNTPKIIGINRIWFFLLFLVNSLVLGQDLVLVVSNQSSLESIDKTSLTDLYLGRQLTHRIRVADVVTVPFRAEFYKRLTGRDIRQVEAMWAQRLFTAEGVPPVMFRKPDAALEWLLEEPNRIMYLLSQQLDDRVKVIYELQ
jgi:hypothetical protein